MTVLHLGSAVALCLLCSLAAGTDNEWVCVPGDAGRWRCGHDEQELEAVPLAEPDRGAESTFVHPDSPYSKPRLPWQPNVNDISKYRPAPGAAQLDPALGMSVKDSFVLRLVSVSTEQDVQAFAEDFNMDPTQVRYTRVIEDGSERFLIVYGGFPNLQRARFAIAALPSAMRSIQPQPVAKSTFENPLERLQKTASDLDPQVPLVATSDTPPEPNPISEDSPSPGKLTLAVVQQVPADADAQASELLEADPVEVVEEAVLPEPEPVLTEALNLDRDGDPRQPTLTQPDERPPETVAQDSRPVDSAPLIDPPAQPPEPGTENAQDAPPPAQPPIAVREPIVASATSAADDSPSFGAIDSGYFTLQLSSQRTEDSARRFIARHGLERSQLHLVLIDEGAGARWLILYSQFPRLEAADASKYLIPSGIRSPWARRIAPLQQNMIRAR